VLARQGVPQAHENWNGLEHSRRLNHRRGACGAAGPEMQHNQTVKWFKQLATASVL
jgi:hypothetical protein